MAIQTRLVDYQHADTAFQGYLAWDDAQTQPKPAVLISHAWAGRSDFENNKAVALAELGYVGFALDTYGKGVLGSSPEENGALMQPLLDDRADLQQRLAQALTTVREQPEVDASKVAVMGYCFGGLCALDMARSGTDVLGAVSFHGLFGAPGNTEGNAISAKVLCLHGHEDPMVPPEDVLTLEQELTAAGCDWQIHSYGATLHAFTNPEANDPDFGTVYSPNADRRSWQSLVNFLEEVLGG